MELKELLLDSKAWRAGVIKLSEPPREIPASLDAKGYAQAYGGLTSYESAIDAAGYATEAEMHGPDAEIIVKLCTIGDDGGVSVRSGKGEIRTDAATLYGLHGLLGPAEGREGDLICDTSLMAASPSEAVALLRQALFEMRCEILATFDHDGSDSSDALSIDIAMVSRRDIPEAQIPFMSIGRKMSERVAAAARRVIVPLIRCEIAEFDSGKGASGRIRLDGISGPWIDADDRNAEWDLAREIDLDMLADMDFDDEAPAPEF